MFDTKIKKEKILTHLIDISKNIQFIYSNMNIHNKNSLEKELRAEITKENILLEQLNISKNNVKDIYLDFINSLNNSLYNNINFDIKDPSLQNKIKEYVNITNTENLYLNDLVLKRFESYILQKFKDNKPSKSKDKLTKLNEDRASISHLALIDYHSSVLRFLNELEYSSNSILIINNAIKERNRLLYTDKLLEEKFLNEDYSINQYKILLANGFDQKYVENIYNKIITDIVNQHTTHCYLYSNKSLENKEKSAKFRVDLQLLKASLYLLNNDIIKYNIKKQKKLYQNSSKKSMQLIYKSLKETDYIQEFDKNNQKIKKLTN